MDLSDPNDRRTITTFAFVFMIVAVWIGAWEFKQFLDARSAVVASDEGTFIYWVAAKLIFWVVPSVLFIKHLGLGLGEVLGLSRFKRAVIWGGGIGLVIVAVNVASKTLWFHKPILIDKPLLSIVNAVIVAPIVEEIMFRGALLNGLLTGFGFKAANVLTAALFLLIHVPGWYFQGDVMSHFTSTHAAAILVLGMLFGYVAMKSDSVLGAIFAHSLNNLTS